MKSKDYKIYHSENIYEERSYMAGKKEGRWEVVEWINANKEFMEESVSTRRGEQLTARCYILELYEPKWQAKLKEWGIEVK